MAKENSKIKKFEKDFERLEEMVQKCATTMEKAETLEQLIEKAEAMESLMNLKETEIRRLEKESHDLEMILSEKERKKLGSFPLKRM